MHLKKKLAPLYILSGMNAWFLEDAARQIKNAYRLEADYEEKKMSLVSADDWDFFQEEANSYDLFSENTLIDASYDKKSLDAPAKSSLNRYLESVNPRCLILIRAAELPQKQLQSFAASEKAVIVLVSPLDAKAMRQWIIKELTVRNIKHDPQVPEIIQRHTEGNMLACAQAIEKISLTLRPDTLLGIDELLQQLSNQAQYQVFDLSAALLEGDPGKAISVLRQARDTGMEATLVLWAFSNEIRLILQLEDKIQRSTPFGEACRQLNIWSTKVRSYQNLLGRLNKTRLEQLLRTCHAIDEQIKSGQTLKIWHNFELMTLALCSGS